MSGRKNVLLPYHLISAGDLSASITSAATNIQYLDNIGIQLVWSGGGSPVGTFQVQASLDGSTWTALDFGTVPATSGNSGSILLNINEVPYNQLRVVYTKTSGTGTLNIWLTGKANG